MLRLVIQIECDSCRETFMFARTSAYSADALHFNTSALSAMLPHAFWHLEKSEQDTFHFCQGCYIEFDQPEEQANTSRH